MQKNTSASVLASQRLQKELVNVWQSESFKNKHYTVELVNDSLYEWHVRLLLPLIDNESPLYEDLVKLKDSKEKEGILLHFVFNASFPFEPPFVRVVEPVIRSKTCNINWSEN